MDILEIFLDLVKISSPSQKEKNILNYIKNILSPYEDVIEIYEDDVCKKINGDSGNLFVKIDGEGEAIAFDSHVDTVEPCNNINPIIKNSIVYSDGSSVLGADDKSGVAVMISVIIEIIKKKIPHPPLTFIFSVCEEKSLLGAKNMNFEELINNKYIFVIDGEGEIGSIILKTPYGCKGSLKIIGKEAHAGICPENGINALCVASNAINKIPFGRVSKNTTANIGSVNGGTESNIVMGNLEMKFEARSYEINELVKFVEYVKKIFNNTCKKSGAIFEENLKYGTPGYKINENDDIVKLFKISCEDANIELKKISCGGGSNANVYRKNGIDAVNLGIGMENVHSCKESIKIEQLYKMKDLIIKIIENQYYKTY